MPPAPAVINAADLLQAWENAQSAPPALQALILLAAAYPGESPQALAALPIGRRDRLLMDLRQRLFGSRLDSLITCPQCGERLELAFDLADLRLEEAGEPLASWEMERDGCWLLFRLPNSADLLAAQQHGGRAALLERCLLEARQSGQPQAAGDLPAAVQAALIQRMAELDPQADVRFPVECPACQQRWMAMFDILAYLWQEVHTWAARTLDEVNLLARAYAWREADILALSPWRRRYYIERVIG